MPRSRHYFPEPGDWLQRGPSEAGFNPTKLDEALHYAAQSEIEWPKDLRRILGRIDRPPYNKVLGPTKERGPATGLVIKDGHRIEDWGDIDRADMTFSATKSYLSVLVGLAIDTGLIRSTQDLVVDYVKEGSFDSEHNRQIRWQHLLQQTSEWQGKLFGIPDTVDHNRSVQGSTMSSKKGDKRKLYAPGSYWEYNDVRVNMLSYAALHVFQEPLPHVLKQWIMEPIGASKDWQWHGYDNAQVDIDGELIPSVPGGAHWGGGLWISTLDHARFGYLMLRRGNWNGRQLISKQWIDQSMIPCEHNPQYGYMWWLNTGNRMFTDASEKSFAAMGAGGNIVFADPVYDLVIVTRWASDGAGIINRIIGSLNQ